MLAAGYDRAAAWIPAIERMDDEDSDRCWAMVALAAPGIGMWHQSPDRFINRDQSRNKTRSACLSLVLRPWAHLNQHNDSSTVATVSASAAIETERA